MSGPSIWTPRSVILPVGAEDVLYTPATVYPAGSVGRYLSALDCSVKRFGARGDGVTDDTAAFQLAFSETGLRGVFVPPGLYKISDSLIFPDKYDFDVFGCGSSSQLIQTGPTVIKWPTAFTTYRQTISNLGFQGNAGTANTLEVIGQSNIGLRGLSFFDVPVGYSAVFADGYAGQYIHDMRIDDIRIYSTTAGRSGIRLGPLTSDQQINNFIMNGTFQVDYCLEMDSGATTLQLTNSHPYNAKKQILKANAGSVLNHFTSVRFDNALDGLVDIAGMQGSTFANCLFQANRLGKNAIILADSINNEFANCQWDGANGSISALKEIGASNNNRILGGQLFNYAAWTTPWDLIGVDSYATNIYPYLRGRYWTFSTVALTAQPSNSIQYYGVNANTTSQGTTEYVIPENCIVGRVWVAIDNLPGAGQTYTVQCLLDGNPFGSALVFNNSNGFSLTLNINQTAGANQVFVIRCTSSASAAPVILRASVQFRS